MIFSLPVQPFLESPTLQHIGWALVHSVWEDASIALCLVILLAFVSRSTVRYGLGCVALLIMVLAPIMTFVSRSTVRYGLGCVALLIMVLAPIMTFGMLSTSAVGSIHPVLTATSFSAHPVAQDSGDPIATHYRPELAIAAVIWIGGVLLLCSRQLGGWLMILGMRRDAIPVTDQRLLSRLNRLVSNYGIHRKVVLAASSMVQVPCIVGCFKPIILFPCSTLTELSPAYLEAILAHELAHVRRHDYLVNLVQTVVETLLFYHPAAWWVSRQIRVEREYCCDDQAVRATGDRHLYCEAMAAMEQIRVPEVPMVLAASGGALLARLRRLLEPRAPRISFVWPAIIVPMMMIAGLCLVQAQTTSTATMQLPRSTPATTNLISIPHASDFTLQRTIPLSPSSSLASLDPFNTIRGVNGGYHSYFPLLLEPQPPTRREPNSPPMPVRNFILYEDNLMFVASDRTPTWRISGPTGAGTLQVSPDLIDDRARRMNYIGNGSYTITRQPASRP